jgi:DNA-binding SARP family transcriptional activator
VATTGKLSFGLLGPLQLRADNVVVPLGTPKQRAVLAMLLMNRNRSVSVDSLLAAGWEDNPPEGARANIHSYTSNLRRLLNSVGVDGRSVLAKVAPGYAIYVDDSEVDLGRFATAKTAALHAAAAGKFEDASRHLSDALAEWRGPVLDDLRDFVFVEAFATAMMEEKVQAHIAHAEAEIVCGRGEGIIGELEKLAAEHSFREPLWAQLISAYYLSDRQSDALEAFQRLKASLADELGIDPSPALQELHGKVLRQEHLDVGDAATTTAAATLMRIDRSAANAVSDSAAQLRNASGRVYPLHGAATRIGRSTDNHIVLDGVEVSRHHAVILDTGSSYVITDLGSANGVQVNGHPIQTTATLADTDRIRMGDHEFIFEFCGGN